MLRQDPSFFGNSLRSWALEVADRFQEGNRGDLGPEMLRPQKTRGNGGPHRLNRETPRRDAQDDGGRETAMVYPRHIGSTGARGTAGRPNPSNDRLLRVLVALLTGFDMLFVGTALLSGRRRLPRRRAGCALFALA